MRRPGGEQEPEREQPEPAHAAPRAGGGAALCRGTMVASEPQAPCRCGKSGFVRVRA
jgi:hypothetical protein